MTNSPPPPTHPWQHLRGGRDTYDRIKAATSAGQLTKQEINEIWKLVGTEEFVFDNYYPAMNMLLDICENQKGAARSWILALVGTLTMFAVMQGIPEEFAEQFDDSLLQGREMFYSELKSRTDSGEIGTCLMGISACAKHTVAADAIYKELRRSDSA